MFFHHVHVNQLAILQKKCAAFRLNSDRPEALTPHYFLGCSLKKRTISVEASGPFGSVKEPLELPPDQA